MQDTLSFASDLSDKFDLISNENVSQRKYIEDFAQILNLKSQMIEAFLQKSEKILESFSGLSKHR